MCIMNRSSEPCGACPSPTLQRVVVLPGTVGGRGRHAPACKTRPEGSLKETGFCCHYNYWDYDYYILIIVIVIMNMVVVTTAVIVIIAGHNRYGGSKTKGSQQLCTGLQ